MASTLPVTPTATGQFGKNHLGDHVARQREIVAELKEHGHDWRAAMDLLHQFEATQAVHIADRDRLRKELGL